MNEYVTMFLVFTLIWVLIYVVSKTLKTDRWGLTTGPFFIVYKTGRFNNALKMLSQKKRFWRMVWNIGAVAGMGMLVFIAYSLLRNLVMLITQPIQAAPLTVLVPGVTVGLPSIPYMLFSFFLLIITHEAAHGIASLVEGIPIKTSGMFLAAVIPGGFVEIDEEKLEKASEPKKLRIFAAGSFANIICGVLTIILVMNFPGTLAPLFNTTSSGVLIAEIVKDGAAEDVGIKKWDIIYAINERRIEDVNDLRDYMKGVSPSTRLTLETSRGNYIVSTKPDPRNASRALIGIIPFNFYKPDLSILPVSAPYHIFMIEYWSNIVLISVALINMLPIYPLDGGRYFYSILRMLKVGKKDEIKNSVTILFLLILGLNLVLSFTNFGFRKL